MTAENLLVNDGRDGKTVEAVREGLPQFDIKASFTCLKKVKVTCKTQADCGMRLTKQIFHTLVVESVYAINTGALVVAPQQKEVLRVLDLVREQQADSL